MLPRFESSRAAARPKPAAVSCSGLLGGVSRQSRKLLAQDSQVTQELRCSKQSGRPLGRVWIEPIPPAIQKAIGTFDPKNIHNLLEIERNAIFLLGILEVQTLQCDLEVGQHELLRR